ncbi:PREDICTED: uncharacterized protein LOC105500924 [Colobus angolensis palliatus]|uniref:uncharacterized protein LOC105500924 n=1 Tax=Colobus angolensis palliatus TaxID=336983 RepID=UPI0005F466B2|nr:PREDICTED: uncharacterized protein LOC105500924 [Colobus angolensis palliatus]
MSGDNTLWVAGAAGGSSGSSGPNRHQELVTSQAGGLGWLCPGPEGANRVSKTLSSSPLSFSGGLELLPPVPLVASALEYAPSTSDSDCWSCVFLSGGSCPWQSRGKSSPSREIGMAETSGKVSEVWLPWNGPAAGRHSSGDPTSGEGGPPATWGARGPFDFSSVMTTWTLLFSSPVSREEGKGKEEGVSEI